MSRNELVYIVLIDHQGHDVVIRLVGELVYFDCHTCTIKGY